MSDSSAVQPTLILDNEAYDQLYRLATEARARAPGVAERLLAEIDRADLRDAGQIPADVVTVGSQVTYRDEATGQSRTVRVVWPQQADVAAAKISVVSPIGAALIGLTRGQRISWWVGEGEKVRYLTVEDVQQG
ncbi:nucleoside diphosphate kinase regulator [Sinimarinibacterium sp. NLF-5-8]|uniref:nucleoside diphosphate kinase regulator n=1 Tax=Sinimarinibacterium sp. NLF-5-8 TaxID=2698684 RepID=UPI00137C0E04|nr:nucleoside diphosphate kinase regulator [Sinimarinibacterium sp. NLF-5-8]QHS09749.1 nucleoside diphosphate kinase regulator [Sinimarinibacterium sp. NLF-5-8]